MAREKNVTQIADARCIQTSSFGNLRVCGHDMRRRRLATAHASNAVDQQTPDLANGV